MVRRWLGKGRSPRRIAGDESGTAGVEFSLIALPLFIFVFGTIDVSMLLFTDSVVNGAASGAARQIRTGVLRSDTDAAAFRQRLCDSSFGFLDCAALHLDVRTFPDWSSVAWPAPQYDDDGKLVNFGFNVGGPGTITTVRVLYDYQVLTPGLSFVADHLERVATVVFLSEPFE